MSPCCRTATTHIPKTYPISVIRKETEHVQTFTFPISLGAKPGQFLMVWLPGVNEVPMSVAMDDGETTKITFFAVGETTKKLATCREGDLIGLRGPFGTNYTWEKGQHLVLVAGGYGAAPMFFVANEAVKDNCTIDFIIGARSKEHLLYLNDVKHLKNTTLHIATNDGSMGQKGFSTDILEHILTPQPKPQPPPAIFSCGPEIMMKRVLEICDAKRIPCFLSLERFMKCGYGLCGSCVMDPLGIRLCVDGPVVSGEIVKKLTEFGKYHRDDVGRRVLF